MSNRRYDDHPKGLDLRPLALDIGRVLARIETASRGGKLVVNSRLFRDKLGEEIKSGMGWSAWLGRGQEGLAVPTGCSVGTCRHGKELLARDMAIAKGVNDDIPEICQDQADSRSSRPRGPAI